MARVREWSDLDTGRWGSEAPGAGGPLCESGNRPVWVAADDSPAWWEGGFSDQVALLEAGRCLRCGGPLDPAPCSAACPADQDVPGFVAALARGSWEDAAHAIFAENLLAATCARICPSEELCESACVLTRKGERPISIGQLERYATDLAFQNPWASFRTTAPPTGRRVTVIGAGPAGLACAGELAALGHGVKLFEAGRDFGGLLRYGVGADRSDHPHLPDEVRAIIGLGVELYLDSPIDTPERLWQIEYNSDAIFLGIGMEESDRPFAGDQLPGILSALQFFEQSKHAPLAPGARVAVIGGGNTAVAVAREAVRMGAAEVTVLCQWREQEVPAFRAEWAAARADGIRFLHLTSPPRFLGSDHLDGIACQDVQRNAAPGRQGTAAGASEFILPVDLAVKALGQAPRLGFLRWIDGLDLDGGRPRVDTATGQTTNPKYFAGGAVVDGGVTIAAAARTGKRAARGIDRWLSERNWMAPTSPETATHPGTANQPGER